MSFPSVDFDVDFPGQSSWSRRRAVDDLHFLDSLLSMEMEEDDIAFLTGEVAEKCTTEFIPWLALKGREVSVPALAAFLQQLFIFTYLTNATPQIRIGRLSRKKLKECLLKYQQESPQGWSELSTPHEILALFFRFLSEKGYDLPLGRCCNTLRILEREHARQQTEDESGTQEEKRGRGRYMNAEKEMMPIAPRRKPIATPATKV